MSDLRKFFVITLRGELGPFTVEDLREEVQAGRVARTDRLRTAFGGSAGTVGEALGAAIRSNRTPHRLSATGAPVSGESRTDGGARTTGSDRLARSRKTSDRTTAIPVARFPWQPVAIGCGIVVIAVTALLFHHPPAEPLPVASAARPSPAATTQPPPAPSAGDSVLKPVQLPQTAPTLAKPTPPEPPTSRPFEDLPQRIPGSVKVWRFDQGGESVGYHDVDPQNHGANKARPNTGVDLSVHKNSGKILACYVANGEWLNFTCQVASAGHYRWSFSASRDGKIYSRPVGLFWTVDHRPVGPPVTISDTGNFNTLQEFTGEVDLPAGLQVLRLNVQGDGVDFGEITFTRITAAPIEGP